MRIFVIASFLLVTGCDIEYEEMQPVQEEEQTVDEETRWPIIDPPNPAVVPDWEKPDWIPFAPFPEVPLPREPECSHMKVVLIKGNTKVVKFICIEG